MAFILLSNSSRSKSMKHLSKNNPTPYNAYNKTLVNFTEQDRKPLTKALYYKDTWNKGKTQQIVILVQKIGVFLGVAETVVGSFLFFGLSTAPFSFSVFCITSLGDCILSQKQETTKMRGSFGTQSRG